MNVVAHKLKGRCLGIDVSTLRQARDGHTVAVVAEPVGHSLHVREVRPLRDDEELLGLLTEAPFASCGIDLALTLPPCLALDAEGAGEWERKAVAWGLPEETFYHYRPEDWLLRVRLPGIAPKPPISNGGPVDLTPLTLRWLRLRRRLHRQGRGPLPLTEVYASAAIEVLARSFGYECRKRFPYRKAEGFRAQWLEELCQTQGVVVPDGLWDALVCADDPLDALTCAWVAWRARLGEGLQAPDWLGGAGGVGWRKPPPLSEADREWLRLWWRRCPAGVLPDPAAAHARHGGVLL